MSKGIANFLERTAHDPEPVLAQTSAQELSESLQNKSTQGDVVASDSKNDVSNAANAPKETVLSKIRLTLKHAADILRESLELVVGGVVFLDTAIGYSDKSYEESDSGLGNEANRDTASIQLQNENEALRLSSSSSNRIIEKRFSQGFTRDATDKHQASKIQAMSAAEVATWDPESRILEGKTLQSFLSSYPKGNIWYIDEDGYFLALEQVKTLQDLEQSRISRARGNHSSIDITKQSTEANMLGKIFHKARQIIFLPLWDAAGGTC